MHLSTALRASTVTLATAASVLASAHDIFARSGDHHDIARELRSYLDGAVAPPTIEVSAKRVKRESNNKKRCRVRPTTGLVTGTATSTSGSTSPTSTSIAAPDTPENVPEGPDSPWKVKTSHEGKTFFDTWDFWAWPDPTHGNVDYQTRDNAWGNGLVDFSSAGNAIIRVETTPKVYGNRKSVRLHDKLVFNGGLLILDAVHMPTGCGTWPAFWSNGPNWPHGGEIDILEGVHTDTVNQASIHTGSGCHITNDISPSRATVHGGTNCASYESGNSGCGQRDNAPNNYGAPFNAAGGGVYTMLWDDSGIKVWFFSRAEIPADIIRGKPLPETWHAPAAIWKADSCNPWTFFKDHFAIINTTLCGDWAGSGGSWQNSGCAASTGYSTCAAYVRDNGNALNEAYWEIKSVKFYNKA